jgi:predicted permease
MDMRVVVNQMVELFLFLGVGYVLFKIKILDNVFNSKLNRFVLYVAIPCMIVNSALTITKYKSLTHVLSVLLIALIIFLVCPLFGYLIAKICRVPKEDLGLYMFMTTFSNIGFIGFPVMMSIFGKESIFYTTIFNLVYNVLVYTLGYTLINMGTEEKNEIHLKDIFSPATISALIAFGIYLGHIHFPEVLTNTIGTIGDMTSPLAMIIIGVTLANESLKDVFSDMRIYPYTILKQIVLPILAYYVLRLFVGDSLTLGVSVICVAMPVGTMAVLLTNRNGGNSELAARSVFITTLVSIVTIPLIVGLFLA